MSVKELVYAVTQRGSAVIPSEGDPALSMEPAHPEKLSGQAADKMQAGVICCHAPGIKPV